MMQQFSLTFTLLSIFSVIAGDKAPAALGQFPYHASIQEVLFDGETKHMCSGAIIAPSWILTSASCYEDNMTGLTVVTGTIKSDNATNSERQERSVRNVILHPNFNNSSAIPKNDIALVELTAALSYNKFVNNVELPKDLLKENATITGWNYIDGEFVDDLQYENTRHISDDECERVYPDRLKQQCYGPIEYTCLGYTGDPIVNNNVIHGIAAYPLTGTCDSYQYPYIYTDVLMYMDFINEYVHE